MAVTKLTAAALSTELQDTSAPGGGPLGMPRPAGSVEGLAEWVVSEVARRAPDAPAAAFNEACRRLAFYEFDLQMRPFMQRSESLAGQELTIHNRPSASSWLHSGAANAVRAWAPLRAGII